MVKVKMDFEDIRSRAYFLSLENQKYSALIRHLVGLEYLFREHPRLCFTDSYVTVIPEKLVTFYPCYEHGKWEILKYYEYCNRKYPEQTIHWLIAEREYVLDCVYEHKNCE